MADAPRRPMLAMPVAMARHVSAMLADMREPAIRDEEIRAGLHGFNGALAGLAAFSFIADPATAAAVTILAATAIAWLFNPMSRWLRTHGLGYFSSPCVLVTWFWLPGFAVQAAAPSGPAASHGLFPMDALQWSGGLLSGLAQTGFASGAIPGLLVLIGIAAASRRHALASAAHLLLHASRDAFDAGLLGFNGAPEAIALIDAGVVSMPGGVVVSVAAQAVATRFGWPAMTAPFVVATWSMQGLGRYIAKRRNAKRAAAP